MKITASLVRAAVTFLLTAFHEIVDAVSC